MCLCTVVSICIVIYGSFLLLSPYFNFHLLLTVETIWFCFPSLWKINGVYIQGICLQLAFLLSDAGCVSYCRYKIPAYGRWYFIWFSWTLSQGYHVKAIYKVMHLSYFQVISRHSCINSFPVWFLLTQIQGWEVAWLQYH